MNNKQRFEVDTAGMKALQAGREPWQLAKELVANCWDEPTATKCEVSLKSLEPRKAQLVVYDDGIGFNKVSDAWTLMGHTVKRGDPTVRGRFNIGEKEILSVAISAVVHTSGKVISFPQSGGRYVKDFKRPFKGTQVSCLLAWGNRQVDNTVAKLKELLPPKNITYTVNGETIPSREPMQITEATLDTIIQDAPNEPIRPTRRKTNIELYYVNGKGTLYEMGIPIQEIQCPYLVNVMQKVPMPPNRDVVRDSYLQDIYKAILEATVENLPQEQAAETWVRTAIEDKDINPETVKTAMDKRFGENVVLWSSDSLANERATEAGYEVVHGRTLSEAERNAMQGVGLTHSSMKFGLDFASATYLDDNELTDGMRSVSNYVKNLARELLGVKANVSFYKMKNGYAAATWDKLTQTLSFDVAKLGKAWFENIRPQVTKLILHELSHVEGNGHDYQYINSLAKLSGKAVHLALEKPEVFKGG
jgi:hypothetical protein